MDVLTRLELLSDAERLALAGSLFWIMAIFCSVMERRRARRRDPARLEKVGWVPWTALFIACAIIGAGMLAPSLPAVLATL